MTDVHSKDITSFILSQIRSKNSTPELLVRKFLFSKGLRFDNHKRLTDKGWRVSTVYECDLKPGRKEKTYANLIREFKL